MQVIVIAILALLVLVILAVTFVTKMGKISENTDACASKGGVCKTQCGEYETNLAFTKCPEQQLCCVGESTAQGSGSQDRAVVAP